ncbi:MAG: transposase [Desertifilum sp.]|nr:transposase [Desertifilum sp.]
MILTKAQTVEMEHILDVCTSVWNYALRERKDWIASRKCPVNACSIHSEYIVSVDAPYPGYAEQCKALTQAKKTNIRLSSVNAQVLQQVLKKLDQAFKEMKDRNFGFPRFKKRGAMRSFVFPQLSKNSLGQGVIKLPSIGLVKFRQSRPAPDGFDIKQARIVKRASGFYLMLAFQADVNIPEVPLTGHVVGVDVGLQYFVSTSDGLEVERPQFFVDMQRQLKLLQRFLKHKVIGSSNWRKMQKKVARLHERISNTRKDFHFKTAHRLCSQGETIAVEQLNLIGLSRGFLGKQMLDAGHGQFLNQILPWVCFKRGVAYHKVDARGTSQECPDCGDSVKKGLKERWHNCLHCGSSKPRDVASAQVIRNRAVGRTVLQNACGDGLTGAGNCLVKSR